MPPSRIVFSRPYRAADELPNLAAVLASGHVHGDGAFTRSATESLQRLLPGSRVLLTGSGTHALEMAGILLELGPGDEVILPSFTFPSAATAIVARGAVPVFVDIDERTGNVDPAAVEAAIGPRTRAVSVMHYGGVGVDMDAIASACAPRSLPIIEDNAHGLGARRRGRALGTLGALAAQSFHDTKNVHSGEGGALVVNDPALFERAEIIREKGTDRSRFLRGEIDKYTWVDVGSSYLMSEVAAAVLDAQLAEFPEIQRRRHRVWDRYSAELQAWAEASGVRLMRPPPEVDHPAHMFYAILPSAASRDALISHLREAEIIATFHFIPLDSSPAGRRHGRTPVACVQSQRFAERLVRLPLWAGMSEDDVTRVVERVTGFDVARAAR